MYPPGHHNPTVAPLRVLIPVLIPIPIPILNMHGNGGGQPKPSLDRRRATNSRLSCISEHLKENTPSSEDEPSSSLVLVPPIGIRTPSLEPVHRARSRHNINGRSQSSGDGSTVSTFQLDSEEVEEDRTQGSDHHHAVLSNWHRTASFDCQSEQAEQREVSDTGSTIPAPSDIFEVQWQVIRWTNTQPEMIHMQGHRRTISGTGFDGPRSSTSEASPLHSPPVTSSPLLGPSSLGNSLTRTSRGTKSSRSGSIDWGKSWPKRKPRRRHDVSENSDHGLSICERPVAPAHVEADNKNRTGLVRPKDREAGLHDNRDSAFKSCPELPRRSLSATLPARSRLNSDKFRGVEPPNHSQANGGRQRQRHHIPRTILKRYRSLRDRLYRGRSSSMYSIRPEFPPPPDGKERRFRSRNSNEIWPSSGDESPIFNTPKSNISPVQSAGRNTDLLAASGLMLAAAELDRLTALAHDSSQTKGPVTNSPELVRISSNSGSLLSESGSSVADAALIPLVNSPPSFFPPAIYPSQISRSPQRQGRKSRKQHSRLSEVTSVEEIGISPRSSYGNIMLTEELPSPNIPFHSPLGMPETMLHEGVMTPLLSISPPSYSDGKRSEDDFPELGDQSQRLIPFRGQGPKLLYELAGSSDDGDSRRRSHHGKPAAMRPPIMTSDSEPIYQGFPALESERMDIIAQESALFANALGRLNSDAETGSNSCHSDTWSKDQGEPGNSEPFYPLNSSYSKQRSHEVRD